MTRPSLALLAALVPLVIAACGPTVWVEGDPQGGPSGLGAGFGGVGAAFPGTGASGTSSSGVSSSGTGAFGWGGSTSSGGTAPDQWAAAFGEGGHQHLRSLRSTPAGEIVIAGYFDGALAFESGPLPQSGLRSGFVAKLDPKGKPIWSHALVADDCAAEAVAVDAAGNVLLTGFVKGTVTIAGQPVSGDGVFAAKLDASGAFVWARTFGSSANMQADRGLAVSAREKGVLLSGSYAGSIDFGGGPLAQSGGAFVAALDDGGDHLWSKGFAGSAALVTAGIEGRFFVATNAEGGVMGLRHFDAGGGEMWLKSYAAGSIGAITVDALGNAVFAGSATTADFGGGPLPSPLPNGEAFVASLDEKGNHRFTQGLPFDQHQSHATALGIDAAGRIGVTGSYVHHVDSSTVIQSAFASLLNPGGDLFGSQVFGPIDGFGGDVTQEGFGIAPAKPGGFYLGGDFYTAVNIAGASLGGSGSSDLFIAKLP